MLAKSIAPVRVYVGRGHGIRGNISKQFTLRQMPINTIDRTGAARRRVTRSGHPATPPDLPAAGGRGVRPECGVDRRTSGRTGRAIVPVTPGGTITGTAWPSG
jgi:hypothetical protein